MSKEEKKEDKKDKKVKKTDEAITTTAVESTPPSLEPDLKDDKSKSFKGNKKGKGNGKIKSKEKPIPKWDKAMSMSPDLRQQSNSSPIKFRYPTLVDPERGVITPSLLLRFTNIFPTGLSRSIFRDIWLNQQYVNLIKRMPNSFNKSDSVLSANYFSNYMRGVAEHIAIYVHLTSVRKLCERSVKGEFNDDTKLKASIALLSDAYNPLTAKFNQELLLYKAAIENYFLPPQILELVEETYSPKFSKFAGVRTIEIMSLVYPIHPSILCFSPSGKPWNGSEYKDKSKKMVSLFIDAWFWNKIDNLDGFQSPTRCDSRILNFIKHSREMLDDEIDGEKGEFRGLHDIMTVSIPEFTLTGKLQEFYDVVPISEGGRFGRINNSQNELDKTIYTQDSISTVYTSRAEMFVTTASFGDVSFSSGDEIPLMESQSKYYDDNSSGRSEDGEIISLTFERFGAYHSTRGMVAELNGMQALKVQFGYENRVQDGPDAKEGWLYTKNTIQPGLVVNIPDRNGGSFLYSIEEDYSNALKNVVEYKPNCYLWFNAIEQPKHSILNINKEIEKTIIGDCLVNADGSPIEGVSLVPSTINDSEMVACYFSLDCIKREISETVSKIWDSPTLVAAVIGQATKNQARYNLTDDRYSRRINDSLDIIKEQTKGS